MWNAVPDTFIFCIILSLQPSSDIIYCFKLFLKPLSSSEPQEHELFTQPFSTLHATLHDRSPCDFDMCIYYPHKIMLYPEKYSS